MYDIDRDLLREIDALDLSEKNKAWRRAMKAAPWKVYVDREREAVASWKETAPSLMTSLSSMSSWSGTES